MDHGVRPADEAKPEGSDLDGLARPDDADRELGKSHRHPPWGEDTGGWAGVKDPAHLLRGHVVLVLVGHHHRRDARKVGR